MTARRLRRCRRIGAASIRALVRIGTSTYTAVVPAFVGRRKFRKDDGNRKWPLAMRGAIFRCRPLVTVIALLNHHHAVGVTVTPAIVPAAIMVHLRARTVPTVAAALDHDGLGAG